MRSYYVYIMASLSRTLYTGVTNDLERRVWEHKHGQWPAFTSRYRIHRLVYLDTFHSVHEALEQEKRIKGWRRARKIALIEASNPKWDDLSARW